MRASLLGIWAAYARYILGFCSSYMAADGGQMHGQMPDALG